MIRRKGRPRSGGKARVAMDLYCDHPACERRATAAVPDSEFDWALPPGWMRMVLRLSSVDDPVDVDLCHEHAIPFRTALRDMCEWTEERPAHDLPVRGQKGRGSSGKAGKARKMADVDAAGSADVWTRPADLSHLAMPRVHDGAAAMAGQRPTEPERIAGRPRSEAVL